MSPNPVDLDCCEAQRDGWLLACSSEVEPHADHQRMAVEIGIDVAALEPGLQDQMRVIGREVTIVREQLHRIADRQAGARANLPGKDRVVALVQTSENDIATLKVAKIAADLHHRHT